MSVSNGEPSSVVTGVTEDKYEVLWKIENILLVQKERFPVDTQKFEIETGRNTAHVSTWIIGLKTESGHVYVYCKLDRSKLEKYDRLPVRLTVQLLKTDGCIAWTDEVVNHETKLFLQDIFE